MSEFESWSDFTDEAADSVNYDEVEMSNFNSDASEFMQEQLSENNIQGASADVGTIKDGSMIGADGEAIKVKGPNGDVDVPQAITDPDISSDDTAEAMANGLLGDGVDESVKANVQADLKTSIEENPQRVLNKDLAEIKADTSTGEEASSKAEVTEESLNESPTGDDTKNQAAAQAALAETPVEKIKTPEKAQSFLDNLKAKITEWLGDSPEADDVSKQIDDLKEESKDTEKVKEKGGIGKWLVAGIAGLFTYSLISARQNYLNGCWKYNSDGTKCKSNIMTCNKDYKPQTGGCNPDADTKSCLPANSTPSKIRRLMRLAKTNSTAKPLGTTAPIKYLDPNCSSPCINEGSADVSSSCSCKSRACNGYTYQAVTGTKFFDAFNNLIGLPGNMANNYIEETSNLIQTLIKIAKWIAIIAAIVVGIIIIIKIIGFFFKKKEPKEGEGEKISPSEKDLKTKDSSKPQTTLPTSKPQLISPAPQITQPKPQPIIPTPQPQQVYQSIPMPVAQPVQQIPQPVFYRQSPNYVTEYTSYSTPLQSSTQFTPTSQPFQPFQSQNYQVVQEPVGQVSFPTPTVLQTTPATRSSLPLYSSSVPIRQLGDPLAINPQLRFGGKKMRIKKYSIGMKKRQ